MLQCIYLVGHITAFLGLERQIELQYYTQEVILNSEITKKV